MRAVMMLAIGMLAATPASAQIWDGGGADGDREPVPLVPSVRPLLAEARSDIRDGRRAGQLDRREARGLRREARAVAGLEDRYLANGLSEAERAELSVRAQALLGLVNARRARSRGQ